MRPWLRRLMLAGTFALGGVAAHAEPLKIRVGWVVVPASTAPLFLEKQDILKHFGKVLRGRGDAL